MKTLLSKILVVVVMVLVCQCAWGANLAVGTTVPVPGWNPNPNSNQELTYISPQADFMLVTTNNWPYRKIASRTWNSGTNQWVDPIDLGFLADAAMGYLSADRSTLFYDGEGLVGLRRSRWSGSSWGPPESINIGRNSVWQPMFTGSKLYFSSDSDTDILGRGDFWVSDYNPITDQFSQAVRIDELNSSYRESALWVSSDSHLMIFASNRPDGYGGEDIYSAIWDESSHMWGNIENLGPEVNTSRNEFLPRIAEDAGLLFFTRVIGDTEERTLMQVEITPEPATLLLLGLGGLALLRKRRAE